MKARDITPHMLAVAPMLLATEEQLARYYHARAKETAGRKSSRMLHASAKDAATCAETRAAALRLFISFAQE